MQAGVVGAGQGVRARMWVFAVALVACGSMAAGGASAPSVVAGAAQLQHSAGNWTVHTSDRAIIHWQQFGVEQGAWMRFVQPSSRSAVLNRVTGTEVSRIDGSLLANGCVYLINPQGVVVGPTGTIRAGSFAASTLNVTNAEFLAGRDLHFAGSSAAQVVNLGRIEATDGNVLLIAQRVANEGTVSAPNGTAALAAGSDVLLTQGNGLFVRPAEGTIGGTGVDNAGVIEAAKVELQACGSMYALAINSRGLVRATGAERVGGRVLLRADGGAVAHSGTLSAQAVDASGKTTGGEIEVSGREVEVADGAMVDASGQLGGGRIRVGAAAPKAAPKAAATRVAEGAVLRADATEAGDGGLVEVSGACLSYAGTALVGSAAGAAGTLALDPADVIIATVGGTLTPAAIKAALEGGAHVVVYTDPAGVGNGDIELRDPLDYISTTSLTLLACRHFRALSTLQDGGTGTLYIVAGWDGATGLPAGASPMATPAGLFDITQITHSPGSYGQGGSVYINAEDGTGAAVVAVGSRNGLTRLFGADVVVRGGSTVGACAQLGYRGTGGALGDIRAMATGDLIVQGGTAADAYAQIGHGLPNDTTLGDVDAIINVGGSDTVTVAAGTAAGCYAQIGHGSANSYGTEARFLWGDVSVVGHQGVELTAPDGPDGVYAQIGHGGTDLGNLALNRPVHCYGLTTALSVTGSVTLTSAGSPVRIGHGGTGGYGDLPGNINVNAAGTIAVGAHCQVGHGGTGQVGDRDGNVGVTATQAVAIAGGHVGHGYSAAVQGATVGGNVTVRANGQAADTPSIQLSDGAQIGHNSNYAHGTLTGDNLLQCLHGCVSFFDSYVGHGYNPHAIGESQGVRDGDNTIVAGTYFQAENSVFGNVTDTPSASLGDVDVAVEQAGAYAGAFFPDGLTEFLAGLGGNFRVWANNQAGLAGDPAANYNGVAYAQIPVYNGAWGDAYVADPPNGTGFYTAQGGQPGPDPDPDVDVPNDGGEPPPRPPWWDWKVQPGKARPKVTLGPNDPRRIGLGALLGALLDGLQHGNVPDSVRIELLALLGQWGWDHHDLGAFIDQINAEHADMWGEGPLLSPDDKQRILDWAAANEHDAPGLAAAKDKFDQQQQDARQREQEAAARRAAEADARRRAELARREAEDARRRSAEAAAQAERDRIRRLSGQDVLDQAADNARNAHDDFDCGARDGLWDMGQNVDGRIDQHFQDQIQAGMDVDDAVAAAQNARADAHDELNALNDLFGEIVDAAMDLAAQCDDAQQQAADQNDKQNNLDNAAQIDKATQRIQAMRNEFNQRMNALYSRYSSSNTAATNNGQQQINSQIGSH